MTWLIFNSVYRTLFRKIALVSELRRKAIGQGESHGGGNSYREEHKTVCLLENK